MAADLSLLHHLQQYSAKRAMTCNMIRMVVQEQPFAVQVCLHACAELIANVPFFEDAEEGFVTSLVTLLHPQVRQICVRHVSDEVGCCVRAWQCQSSSQL